MKNKIYVFAAVFAFVTALFLACSANSDVAGGVSEETNTIAGVVISTSGNAVAGATVMAMSIEKSNVGDTSITDEKGQFELKVEKRGAYGVSAVKDDFAFYELVNVDGKDVSLKVALSETESYSGTVNLQGESVEGIAVGIRGSRWMSLTNAQGEFKLENVPVGKNILMIQSPNITEYDDGFYVLDLKTAGSVAVGPFPAEFAMDNMNDLLKMKPTATFTVPLSREYGLRSWWNMDAVSESSETLLATDSRAWTDGILLYGNPQFVSRGESKALVLNGADQFGVVESDHNLFEKSESFTIETWVRVDAVLDESETYRKNIIGKLGFGSDADENVFSLALVRGECGAADATLAFFLADGASSEFDCSDAAVSAQPIVLREWMYVVASWNGAESSLYIDGALVAKTSTSFNSIKPSLESIFFGKEKLKLALDDVRISVSAVSAADVLYRYYQNGGSL